MSDTQRCSNCLGTKKVMELGMIQKNCPICDGIGWIKKELEPFKEERVAVSEVAVEKKRGRPRKE